MGSELLSFQGGPALWAKTAEVVPNQGTKDQSHSPSRPHTWNPNYK